MRTTLTVDDDVAENLVELARACDRSFKDVVNEALRLGIGQMSPADPLFVVVPHAGHLRAGIDDRNLNELAWEDEGSKQR